MSARGGSDAPEDEAEVREELSGYRAKEIKRILDGMGVDSSDCFEKEELIERFLEVSKDMPTNDAAEEEATAQAAAGDSGEAFVEEDEDVPDGPSPEIVEKCRALRVIELREQLGRRGLPWADCLEKDELVIRLATAMAKDADFSKSGRFTPGVVQQLTGRELAEELQDDGTPILLDVFATWCGPCQLMAPHLAQAAATLGGKVRVAKLDSDENPDMATTLRIGGLPTIILFGRDGKEVTRVEGAMMQEQLLELVTTSGVV